MSWWPYHRETLVLNRPAEAVWLSLKMETLLTSKPYRPERNSRPSHLFNGIIRPDSFRISRLLHAPQTFLPLIRGRIEPTSTGCLVFISYRLFPSTLVFLIFWSSICLLLGLFFLVSQLKPTYALLAFIIGLINYLVCVKNFHLQLRISRQQLIPLITGEKPARGVRPS